MGGSLTNEPNDQHQLIAQITNARDLTGQTAEMILADAGYVTHTAIAEIEAMGQAIAAPEPPSRGPARRNGPDRFGLGDFAYDLDTDTFTCPNQRVLTLRGVTPANGDGPVRRYRQYRAERADCQGCPLAVRCLDKGHASRLLRTPPDHPAMARHRRWMEQPDAVRWMGLRKQLVEPVFGTLKSCFGFRRAYRRGLANVASEWYFGLATINLRTLARLWANGQLHLV